MDSQSGCPRWRSNPVFSAIITLLALSTLILPGLSSPTIHSNSNSQTPFQPPRKSPNLNIAAIIEDRPLAHLTPLLLHFSSILGPSWPIILFTTHQNRVPRSAPLTRAIADGRISIWYLPSDIHLTSPSSVSEFLTRPWIWQMLAPAGHVMIFDAESIICASSPLLVEDFLHYDFVSAPIDPSTTESQKGYSAGLSLRNRSLVLDIVMKSNWTREMAERDLGGYETEDADQWMVRKMREWEGSDGGRAASLPDEEARKKFAVGEVWYETPLGYHRAARWEGEKMEMVDRWCPEHRIASMNETPAFDYSFNPTELKRRYRTSSSVLELR